MMLPDFLFYFVSSQLTEYVLSGVFIWNTCVMWWDLSDDGMS